MKRWFLSVDWCNKGNRGVFCDAKGNSFGKDTQHGKDEMEEILGVFHVILSPQSLELGETELREYCNYCSLGEYTHQFGIASKV